MKYFTIIFLFLGLFFKVSAQNLELDVKNIPNLLRENACAVIRFEEIVFSLQNKQQATERHRRIITVLSEKNIASGYFEQHFDKFKTLKNLKGKVFDARGNLLYEIKETDFQTKNYSQVSYFQEVGMKFYVPQVVQFPYSVEYEWEFSYNGLLLYPVWMPQKDFDFAVQESRFEFICSNSLTFQYKESNLREKVVIKNEKDSKIYSWKVSHLEALEKEPFMPDITDFLPIVYTAPVEFSFNGKDGNMQNWRNIGQWFRNLNENTSTLSEKTLKELQALTIGLTDKKEIVRKVYEYQQLKMRCISLPFEFGNWKPMDAIMVEKESAGDCKSLNNYMISMLKAVGIDAFYSLTRAGNNTIEMLSAFPNAWFNHALVCVPLGNDTLWLECSDSQNPFGYIGATADDRNVLLITKDGGKLHHTRTYSQNENLEFHKAIVNIDENGSGTAYITSTFSGLQYEDVAAMVNERTDKQKKMLQDEVQVPNCEINNFSFSQERNPVPKVVLTLNLRLREYAAQNQNKTRLYLRLNLVNKQTYIPQKLKERKTDVVCRHASIDTDVIIYQIPESYEVEFLPENIDLTSEFGSYSATVSVDKNTVTYIRTLKMNKGHFSTQAYNEMVRFYKKVADSDDMKLVLKKKTN